MVWRHFGLAVFRGLLGPLAIVALLSAPLFAAVLTVTDCGDTVPGGAPGQLRRLIDEAAPGDVIVVPACTIQLNGDADDDENASGDLDITKSLTIRGAGSGQTGIAGVVDQFFYERGDRVFDIHFGVGPVEISDLAVGGGNLFVGLGGGISNLGVLTLARVAVSGNQSRAGGGGIANSGSLTIRDSLVSFNSAPDAGGGIWNSGALTLVNTTVSNNVAAFLGPFATPTTGAGIENGPGGTLDATNVTIVANHATGPEARGAGVAGGGGTIRNSIIARNVANPSIGAPSFSSNCGISFGGDRVRLASGGHNLSSDGTCDFLDGPGDVQNVDPGLDPLAANGGPTPTHALVFGSPAIDAGDPASCPPADQRGRGRPADGTGDDSAICDIGAYEYRPGRFLDVPEGNWAQSWIESLHAAGVTAGCLTAPLRFCPQGGVTRAHMAVFLLRAAEGPAFVPPGCETPPFRDVPCSDALAGWIAELARRGVTAGCGDGNYCPGNVATREQMAVFVLRARLGASFTPPPCSVPTFTDVPCSSPFAAWIEELTRRAITAGCSPTSTRVYCPQDTVTRAEMAVLLGRTFDLPL